MISFTPADLERLLAASSGRKRDARETPAGCH